MDKEICKSIAKLIHKISTNARDGLDERLLKELQSYAGQSDVYLKYSHGSLVKQLGKKHSEIRLGTFLIINEFFKKSSFYREILLDDFQLLIGLTVGKKLPPPVEAAKDLQLRTIRTFEYWHSRFSESHPRLNVAHNYIKNVLKINFDDSLKRNAADIEKAELEQERRQSTKRAKLEVLLKEIEEHESDICQLITQMKNCFSLVITTPEQFLGDTQNSTENIQEEVDFSEHGMHARSTITIQFNPESTTRIEQTEDNQVVLENLKEFYMLAKNRYFPLLSQWLKVVSKCDDSVLLKKVTDLKDDLSCEMNSFEKLNLIPMTTDEAIDSTDESDFEEVPEKEGYEEFAIAPPVSKFDQPSTSGTANNLFRNQTSTTEVASTGVQRVWTCRAPLPSGNLCPRQDKIKCPFHGKIIPRDEDGNATEPEDITRLAKEKEKEEKEKVPDWQEPKFLSFLKAQIGIDLTIRQPKKGAKSFNEQYPKLTDIRQLNNTPRSRLKKKIFGKKAVKRVADPLIETNMKRHKE